MKRRDFAATLARSALGATVIGSLPAYAGCSQQATPQGEKLDSVGLQLYTVRNMMERSVRDTLVDVARIGYKEVEFAGYFGESAESLRELLDGLGVRAPSAHVSLEEMRADLDGVMEAAETIGHEYLIVPWLNEPDRTLDGYRRIADELNELGARVHNAGFQLGYHNHNFEFEQIDGHLGYDILLDNCQADLVAMEIDLYWIATAGRDAREYFSKYPGRYRLCHCKDRDANGNMAAVGKGTLDFKELLAAGRAAGLEHFFVEHDQPADPIASITASYAYLSTLTI